MSVLSPEAGVRQSQCSVTGMLEEGSGQGVISASSMCCKFSLRLVQLDSSVLSLFSLVPEGLVELNCLSPWSFL